MEARVHYDLTVRHKTPSSPPWYRRVLFITASVGVGAWLWRRQDPEGFQGHLDKATESCKSALNQLVEFFTRDNDHSQVAVTLH